MAAERSHCTAARSSSRCFLAFASATLQKATGESQVLTQAIYCLPVVVHQRLCAEGSTECAVRVKGGHLLAFSLRSSLRCLKPPTYFLHWKELKHSYIKELM